MLLTGIIPIGSMAVMAIVRVIRVVFVAVLVAVVVAFGGVSGAWAEKRHTQVDALFAPWSGTTTPGCAVAVSRDGALDYARGYGMGSLEYDVAITPESIFHVASVSKQFTAFAIGLLAQDGKLSLDDDIRKYLPELPDYGQTVTIAQMVHHTAGMREEFHLMYLAGWRYDDPRTEADALRISAKQRALNFAPGAEPLYTNSHYTLLAMVVQRVSGKPLREFAEERIFRPLGMTDTRFQNGHTEVVRRRASGYRAAEEGRWRVSLPRSDFVGASNLMTTVGDLLKWDQNLIDARVGGRALVDWMQTSATLNGKLLLRWARDMSLTLEPVGGDHFVDGIYTVTFTRAVSGDVNGLTISTRRVRRLRAERVVSPMPTQARASHRTNR
jgi:CubicO group peptidase (beta-lactamase class C family)